MNETKRTRRLAEVTLAVAFWIALGLVFHLKANLYLLLGVPITAAFQLFVRRRPLCSLWVRDATAFRLGATGWLMAAALAAYPSFRLEQNLRARGDVVESAWYVASVAGAVGAAFALKNSRRQTFSDLLQCLGSAGVIGVVLVVMTALIDGAGRGSFPGRISECLSSLLLYIPVVFVLEEVSFRGAFDAHAQHPGEPGEYWTAFFVSALWGLWHIPVASFGHKPWLLVVVGLIGSQCAVGAPLSLYWRKSGNLFVPGATHALIDALRNAILYP